MSSNFIHIQKYSRFLYKSLVLGNGFCVGSFVLEQKNFEWGNQRKILPLFTFLLSGWSDLGVTISGHRNLSGLLVPTFHCYRYILIKDFGPLVSWLNQAGLSLHYFLKKILNDNWWHIYTNPICVRVFFLILNSFLSFCRVWTLKITKESWKWLSKQSFQQIWRYIFGKKIVFWKQPIPAK